MSKPIVFEEQFGKGKMVKQPFVRLKDYVTHTIQVSPSSSSSFQSKSSRTPYPLAHYVNCDKFYAQHRFFLAAITTRCEPNTYVEAIKDECWREAMRKEIQALENNGTWTI